MVCWNLPPPGLRGSSGRPEDSSRSSHNRLALESGPTRLRRLRRHPSQLVAAQTP
jgi:hypothetical protein